MSPRHTVSPLVIRLGHVTHGKNPLLLSPRVLSLGLEVPLPPSYRKSSRLLLDSGTEHTRATPQGGWPTSPDGPSLLDPHAPPTLERKGLPRPIGVRMVSGPHPGFLLDGIQREGRRGRSSKPTPPLVASILGYFQDRATDLAKNTYLTNHRAGT